MKNRVVLVGFYNEKALGLRYLANALLANGFEPVLVFMKSFNSHNPEPITEKELELLKDLIKEKDPLFVGLSVMSSLILSESDKVNKMVKENFDFPVAWGGVHATVATERFAKECTLIMRGEGEDMIVELAQKIQAGEDWRTISGISYYDENGNYVANGVGLLNKDVDRFGTPIIGGENMYKIDKDKIVEGDPQLKSFVYELSCSRGCPYQCTYCGAVCIKRVYTGQPVSYLRFRTVENVMNELLEAKRKIPKLRLIHFWDEVFPTDLKWVEEFTRRYKAEIGLPFRIWGHPLTTKDPLISMLADAGLHQVEMGIQSGSPYIRKEIYHRNETQEQVIAATKCLAKNKIPEVYYDFMICHPFETLDQLIESFDLCLQLEPPFHITMHGLGFFPETDIAKMAIEKGIYTEEEMEGVMYGSIQDQFDHMYGSYYKDTPIRNIWRDLIYLTQFMEVRDKVVEYSKDPEGNAQKISALKAKMEKKRRFAYIWERVKIVLKIGK